MIGANEDQEGLPKDWAWARIGEICDLVNGRAFKAEDWSSRGIPIIRIQNLNNHDAEFNYCDFDVEEKYLVCSGQLLFAWSGTPGTSFGAHIWNRGQGVLNQHIFKVNINESNINKRYLMNVINYNVSQYINKAHGTAGLAHITKKKFESSLIPLPPLPEQHRIVARIDELISRLDAGVEELQKAKAQLKRYRQAILKAAVDGKLTTEWRAAHPDAEPSKMLSANKAAEQKDFGNSSELSKHPRNWQIVKVEDAGRVQLGRQRAPKHHMGEYMRPYLRVANVFENRIDTTDVLMMNFTPEEFKTYQLHYGDILLNEGQSLELIGRPAIYRDELPGSCFQNTLVRFSPFDGIDSDYSLCVFRSYFHNGMFRKIAKWTTTMAHLGAGRFSILPFPLPPLLEQKEIASKISQIESVVENAEDIIGYSLKRTNCLRQSILKHAFEGKLVPQDPNDEPASVLLDRIQVERATGSTRKSDRIKRNNRHQMRLTND